MSREPGSSVVTPSMQAGTREFLGGREVSDSSMLHRQTHFD